MAVKLFLLITLLGGVISCAGTKTDKKAPYKYKEYTKDFDFSTLKKGTQLYIKHKSGIYYNGIVDLEKSEKGYLCLYQGSGSKCFQQKNIEEITTEGNAGNQGKNILINLGILAVFFVLVYYLPRP